MGILADQLAQNQYDGWQRFFALETDMPYFRELDTFVTAQCAAGTVYPPAPDIFNAFRLPADRVRAVILGQDPYHEEGEAMGLSFSVRNGSKMPPSLRNIQKELAEDLEVESHGTDLTPWAEDGVFLLNAVLTVNAGQAFSHAGHGWEQFVEDALRYLCASSDTPLAVVLWGAAAKKSKPLFERCAAGRPLLILESAHPSPLSSYRGFFGSKPFSKINHFLAANGSAPICWQV